MRQRTLKLKLAPVVETEEGVQSRIIQALGWLGHTVLSTVHRWKRQTCPACGYTFWPKGGYGSDKGIGDLLVGVPKAKPRLWLMLDVKRPGGKLSPEQKALADKGLLWRVESEQEALEVLKEWEAGLL